MTDAYSMKLDESNWDLDLDANGDLATVHAEERIAQDVATACLLWRGESMWDETAGVPYQTLLGGLGNAVHLVNGYLRETAETVLDVEDADPGLEIDRRARTLTGEISINGGATNVEF
jgi:hypothetical protein